MSTDPRIILGFKSPQINMPGELMALKNVAQEAQYKHSVLKFDIFNNVKKTALSAYEQAANAPEPEKRRVYSTTWLNTIDEMEKSGLMAAAGFSPEEIQQGRANIIPPEIARASAVSLADIGKREQADAEYAARKRKADIEEREITRREQKDLAEQNKAREKSQLQQGGQLYFTAFQAAIAAGADDQQADAMARQALTNAGPQSAGFDPDTMAVTDEGDFIKTGGQKAPPVDPNGLEPLGPKLPTGENYDWRKAYLYNASINPKFNPQTAKTLVDYRTGRVIPNEPVLIASERVAKAGASNVTVGDFGKAAGNKLDITTIDAADALDRLSRIHGSFKPEYLTWPRQWTEMWSSFKERAGVDLSPKDKERLTEYTRFRRKTLNSLNLYIKMITGAQVGQTGETIRLSAAQPTMDDSPAQFKAKLDDVIEELQDVLGGIAKMKQGGPNAVLEPYSPGSTKPAPKAKVAPKETWSADDQKRLEELERKYGK